MRTKIGLLLMTLLMLVVIPVGANAVGVGKACGGFPGPQCDAGLFCEKPAGKCSVIDMMGKCVKVPQVCPMLKKNIIFPVCGCNGTTYNNDCERQRAMVSKNHNGKCK
jgi:hypothetical protein